MQKKQYLFFLLPIVVMAFSSCTTTNKYTAIAKSELTKQMLDNQARLPVITNGIEENVVYDAGQGIQNFTYADVESSLTSHNPSNANNVDNTNSNNNAEFCLVTYSGETATGVGYYGNATSTAYKYRVRKCSDVSVGMDKLNVEESNSTGTYWAVAGGITGLSLIILLISASSAP